MRVRKRAHIGTSGWHYKHWKGSFYPEGMNEQHFLGFYAGRFHTVEINSSFYRLPSIESLKSWKDSVPGHFLFAAKASRYITHMKKLKDPEKPVSKFLKRMEVLGDKLGPILFQLPPRWNINVERLDAFLQALPSGFRYAFEFRDPSWFHEHVFGLLARNEAAFCIYDLDCRQSPKEVTAPFVYIRLHGAGEPYKGKYDKSTLWEWARTIGAWAGEKKDVYFYFD